MDSNTFKKLWDSIAEKEIGKTIAFNPSLCKIRVRENDGDFRNTIYHRYENERMKYRGTVGVEEEDKLDRHKIAGLFYAAFVDKTKGYFFEVFCNNNQAMERAEAILTHETGFNIAQGILETIIIENNRIKDDGYKKYLKKNGLLEPELICCDNGYKMEVLKQLIYAQQKERKLSVAQLAVMFSLWESYTLIKYKLRLLY